MEIRRIDIRKTELIVNLKEGYRENQGEKIKL
jgi:hypothetical protein